MKKLSAMIIAAALVGIFSGCGTISLEDIESQISDLMDNYHADHEDPPVVPPIVVPDEPPVTPPAPSGELAGFQWVYGGENFSGAVRDPNVTVTITRVNSAHIYYTITGLDAWTKFWTDCNQIVCGFKEDGKGGKIEWCRPSTRDRNLKNWDGYKGWVPPAKGSKVKLVWVSVDGKLCSNVVEIEYR